MAYKSYTLIVEQILKIIKKAERWRTLELAYQALIVVNRMEENMREEKRRLSPDDEEADNSE